MTTMSGHPSEPGASHSVIAHVDTAKPSPYLKQFCKHFAHKAGDDMSVDFDDTTGEIRYRANETGEQVVSLDASQTGVLVLRITSDTTDGLRSAERWVGDHLERFGRRDGLEVKWVEA
jgi:uncharacterized protein